MKRLQVLALLLLVSCTMAMASQKRKVMFIGIDGVRSDALQAANTPHLDSLIATGSYTYDSWCLGITVSGPSWSTIFTGVWYQKHGVTDNSYSGSHFDQYNLFPKLAKQYKPNLFAAEVMEWPPLIDNVPNQYDGYNVRIKVPDGQGTPTETTTITQLANSNLDVMTLYFDAVDLAGHSNGFSPNNPSYIAAIENVDAHVGAVINALKNRPNYANEDWLILITTDHGGLGTGHGGNSNEERHIWWVAAGTHIKSKQLVGQDPGSYRIVPPGVDTNILKHTPVQADIAVTALHHLLYDANVRPDTVSAWNLDGKSLLDSIYDFSTTGIEAAQQPELDAKVYPNPSTGLVTFWFDPGHEAVSYSVYNMSGALVKEEKNISMNYRMTIDMAAQPAGNYIVRIRAGERFMDKKITITH
jgi:predicted AlkP superfamily pyrophosphatase or phosphodiesterase